MNKANSISASSPSLHSTHFALHFALLQPFTLFLPPYLGHDKNVRELKKCQGFVQMQQKTNVSYDMWVLCGNTKVGNTFKTGPSVEMWISKFLRNYRSGEKSKIWMGEKGTLGPGRVRTVVEWWEQGNEESKESSTTMRCVHGRTA